MKAHDLANKLLELPNLDVWVNVDSSEGGRYEWNISIEDSHACNLDLDEARGDENLYDENEIPIYSPIIYIYDSCNKPDYSFKNWIEFEKLGFKQGRLELENKNFYISDKYNYYELLITLENHLGYTKTITENFKNAEELKELLNKWKNY